MVGWENRYKDELSAVVIKKGIASRKGGNMFQMRKKKMIVVFPLATFIIFFLSNSFCMGQDNNSHQQKIKTAVDDKQNTIPNKIQNKEDYLKWKKRYDEVQIKMKKAKNSKTIGTITGLGGIAVVLLLGIKKWKKGGGSIVVGGYTWIPGVPQRLTTQRIDLPTVEEYKLNLAPFIGGIVLLCGGAGLLISGGNKHNKAKKEKKALEKEGNTKGYLNLKLNPETKSIVLSYTIEF